METFDSTPTQQQLYSLLYLQFYIKQTYTRNDTRGHEGLQSDNAQERR